MDGLDYAIPDLEYCFFNPHFQLISQGKGVLHFMDIRCAPGVYPVRSNGYEFWVLHVCSFLNTGSIQSNINRGEVVGLGLLISMVWRSGDGGTGVG